jgi:hypothetical protein
MYEFLAIAVGLLLGLRLPQVHTSVLLLAAGLTGVVVYLASGEIEMGPAPLALDVGQTVVAVLIGRTLARRATFLRGSPVRRAGPR